jgi:hypothetical protein
LPRKFECVPKSTHFEGCWKQHLLFLAYIYFRQVSTWKIWFRLIQRRIFHGKNGPNLLDFKFKKFQIVLCSKSISPDNILDRACLIFNLDD